MKRIEIQDDVLSRGDAVAEVQGLQVRPVTFASLLVLRKLKNPLAAVLENGGALAEDMEALVELLWVQCAPWPQVRRLVSELEPGGDRAAVDAAILDFAVGLTPAVMKDAVGEFARQLRGVNAVAAEVLPDDKRGAERKN